MVNNSQLAIHISRTSVNIAEVLRSNQDIVWQESRDLIENTHDGYQNNLAEFIDSLNLKTSYQEYSLAWSTPNNVLIPNSLMQESTPANLFQFVFGMNTEEESIHYNRLSELELVSIFEMPDWVKSFFVRKFPRILFTHEHAMMLRALFQKKTYTKQLFVSVNDEYVNIFILHKNELIFSNAFEYQTGEDILYYILHTLEKENYLDEEKSFINFLFINTKTEKTTREVVKKLEQLKVLKQIQFGLVESALKLQTLCV